MNYCCTTLDVCLVRSQVGVPRVVSFVLCALFMLRGTNKKSKIMRMKKQSLQVLHAPGWPWEVGMPSLDHLSGFTTLNAQSTRYGARPGPKLEPCVHAAPRVPRGREHEKSPTAGRVKNADVRKKFIWYIVMYSTLRCRLQVRLDGSD
ncbi:unnamed protein product [Laminaria digitata]